MSGVRELLREKYQEVMKVEDLADMLRITKQTLYIQMAKGDFPIQYGKIGKHYLFNTEHVADWLEEPGSSQTGFDANEGEPRA